MRCQNCQSLLAHLALDGLVMTGWIHRDQTGIRDPNAYRELMVYFWYPTSGKFGDGKGSYLPGTQRMDTLPEVLSTVDSLGSGGW